MEKKRKLPEEDKSDVETHKVKKKKKHVEGKDDTETINNRQEIENNEDLNTKSKKKPIKNDSENNNNKNDYDSLDSKNIEKQKTPIENVNNKIPDSTTKDEPDHTSNAVEADGDEISTPTTKKPPRKSGETKKQYKRRMKALREAGLLIDPPVVEGVKKEKRNPRKTRKEKRMIVQQKNNELDRFRSIVQVNYLKTWKNDPSKWKFNKNVQGKILKHMFDASRIPQDIFEILIEYITGTKKSTKMHDDINKKCSQIVEAMEKWSSADETEKKKLTEPDQQVYERARELLQSLA